MRYLKFFASLKLAVLVILGLAFACATATVLESLYDTPTAKYWVYSSFWFRGILALLCINLASVMVDRWPWKIKHIPFLLAHIGILLLMFGSWLTEKTGLDGSLRVTEGETGSVVEVDEPMFVVTEKGKVQSFPVKWIPPEVKFSPRSFKDELGFDLKIDDYITHADPVFEFVPRDSRLAPVDHPKPALKITLAGGPMQITQDFWLWTGDPSTQGIQAGPAWLELADATDPASHSPQSLQGPRSSQAGPKLSFKVEKGGILSWKSVSSTGEVTQGRAPVSEIKDKAIDPRWKMVKITLNQFVPDAWVNTTYKPSRIQHGEMASPSAIHVIAGDAKDHTDVWLGMGSRAVLNASGREIEIGYFPKRLLLPFSVRLDRFAVDRYQGTNNPAAYSSKVTILGGDPANAGFSQVISMNEPLEYQGITLYQASYEDAMPRPVTSIFSVNRDPGRLHKYIGSLLIVLGSAWLFAVKYRSNKKSKQAQAAARPTSQEAGVSV